MSEKKGMGGGVFSWQLAEFQMMCCKSPVQRELTGWSEIGDVKTAIRVDAILDMQLGRQFSVVVEHRCNSLYFSTSVDLDLIDEVRSQATTAPDQSSVRCGLIDNGLPFRFKQIEIGIAQPIHVVEQNKTRDSSLVFFQKALYRICVRRETINEAVLQPLEIVRF